MRNYNNHTILSINNTKASVFFRKNIIAGFPGVGKSTAAQKHPNWFCDLESSDYHWITDENGNKSLNPEWPNNYINSIIDICSKEEYTIPYPIYVLISTHKEVLSELGRRNIYFSAMVPKTKSVYIERYKDRGNSDKFISSIEDNFERYIKDVEESKACEIYYTDEYLETVITGTPFTNNTVLQASKNSLSSMNRMAKFVNRYTCNISDEDCIKTMPVSDKPDNEIVFGVTDVIYQMNYIPEHHTIKHIVLVPPFCDIPRYNHKYNCNLITVRNKKSVSSYVSQILSMASNVNTSANYVIAYATPEVIEEFNKRDYDFTLFLNFTYCETVKNSRLGGFKYPYDERSHTDYTCCLSEKCFRTVMSANYFMDVIDKIPGFISASDIASMKYFLKNKDDKYSNDNNYTIGTEMYGTDISEMSVGACYCDITEMRKRFEKEYIE